MSTRATYLFRNQSRRETTIYIHHDGYPEGAAGLYLLPAIEQTNGDLTIESFIRANDRAEITQSHEAHGDTEYRYTIDLRNDNIIAMHRDLIRHPAEFRPIYRGAIADFLNRFAPKFRPGVVVRCPRAGCWMTADMANAHATAKAAEAASYRERFPDMVGNQSWYDSNARKAAEFAQAFRTDSP